MYGILNAVRELETADVTGLATEVDLSKGVVYDHLAILRQQVFITETH